jgi:hypothetical protein
MRKDHENKYTMLTALEALFNANMMKIALIAALVKCVADFKTLLATIKTKTGMVDDSTSGKTQIKYDAEDDLIASMLRVGPALFAYANNVNDAALREKSNFSKTSLRRMRDMELVVVGNALYATAMEVSDKLADYRISADTLAELKAKVDAYEKAVGAQGSSVSQHSTAVINIAETFRAIDVLLTDKIDPLMQTLEKDEPVFFREYKQTRLIKELGAPRKTKEETAPSPTNPSTPPPVK